MRAADCGRTRERPACGRRAAAIVLGGVLAVACGGGASNSSPVPTPPSGTFVNIAGRWTGVLESANLPPRPIALTVVQSGNCVDGVWEDRGEWTGAISGFATTDAYEGQISLEGVERGGRCSAVGLVSGPVGDSTLRWTGTGFTGVGAAACQDPLPQSIVISMQRE